MRENFRMLARRATRLKLLYPLLLILLLGSAPAPAQTIIAPSNTDNLFFTPSDTPANIMNNALIDYYCNSGGQLMAVTWDDGSKVFCTINDGSTALAVTIHTPGGYTLYGTPDVILGGDNKTSPASDTFYIGIVYNATDVAGNADVFLQVATITDPGSVSFAVTSCSHSILLDTSPHTNKFLNPHIDIITKDIGSGLVSSDNFVVSWGMGALTGLYCPSGLSFVANNCKLPTGAIRKSISSIPNLELPDVAGIERSVGVSTVDDIALFTYQTSVGIGKVYYQEWDMSTNTVSAASVIYTGCSCAEPLLPRIDAVDCYTQHDPVISGIVNYDIVFSAGAATNPIGRDIYSYNNLAGPYDCSNGSFDSVNNGFPQVACGPGFFKPDSFQYDIGYGIAIAGTTTSYSQLIDWNTGNLNPNNSTYYQVNTSSSSCDFLAISSSVNNLVPDHVFVSWYNIALGEIDYKISASPVGYRPASVNTITSAKDWKLSPNPAIGYINLNTTNSDISGITYSIIDITGRMMQSGPVTAMQQQVSIADLVPGMYMLQVYAQGTSIKTMKFVKE